MDEFVGQEAETDSATETAPGSRSGFVIGLSIHFSSSIRASLSRAVARRHCAITYSCRVSSRMQGGGGPWVFMKLVSAKEMPPQIAPTPPTDFWATCEFLRPFNPGSSNAEVAGLIFFKRCQRCILQQTPPLTVKGLARSLPSATCGHLVSNRLTKQGLLSLCQILISPSTTTPASHYSL